MINNARIIFVYLFIYALTLFRFIATTFAQPKIILFHFSATSLHSFDATIVLIYLPRNYPIPLYFLLLTIPLI